VVNDDPQLTVRHLPGRQPLRVVMDRGGITPDASRVFDQAAPTLLFSAAARPALAVEQHLLDPADDPLDHLLRELHRRNIRSVLVEGGAELLRHFITRGLWDEARIIEGEVLFGAGTPAPDAPSTAACMITNGPDRITLHLAEGVFTPDQHPSIAWPW
jgi:diaminohydroxyphosphoribosylaminopyrimidine deaminase/5-amino-6-(5-phosphoribosylamino)uracil reductase